MRIPFTKAYRAFEEFDGVSTEQCERHLRRVAGSMSWLPLVMMAAGVLAGGAAVGVLVFLYHTSPGWRAPIEQDESAQTLALVVAVAFVVFVAAIGALLVRDYAIYRGIHREIHKARCPKCKQSLLGVPVRAPHSAGLPTPGDAWVRCPECGKRHDLMQIGLTPRDLIPLEFREASPDLATKRGSWFGREHAIGEDEYTGW